MAGGKNITNRLQTYLAWYLQPLGTMTNGIESNTYLCSQLVSVVIGEPEQNPRVALGNLEEIATDHALVLLDAPIAAGAQVIVKADKTDLRGHAAHWDFAPDLGYYIDVRLSDKSQWSPDVFSPDHLLAVPAMAA